MERRSPTKGSLSRSDTSYRIASTGFCIAANTKTADRASVSIGGASPCTPIKTPHKEESIIRKRTTAINIRVTEKEKQQIQRLAGKCGLSLSEYLRKLALGYAPREIPSDNFYSVRQMLESLVGGMSDEELSRRIRECLDSLDSIYIYGEEVKQYGNNKNMGDKGQPFKSGQLRREPSEDSTE